MLEQTLAYTENKVLPLASKIESEAGRLVEHEIQFAKCAIQREWILARRTIAVGLAGASFLIPSLFFIGFAVIEGMVAYYPGMPRWSLFLIVGVLFLAATAAFLSAARSNLMGIGSASSKILDHLQENLLWLKNIWQ